MKRTELGELACLQTLLLKTHFFCITPSENDWDMLP